MRHKKEIDALCEQGRAKYLDLKLIRKIAPKLGRFLDKAIRELKSGKIGLDEATNIFGYGLTEFIEVVYGDEAYYYAEQKLGIRE